jgi:nucleoside-diphosphate-sugar epimerase
MPDGAVLGDPKNVHLKQLDGAVDRLRLFKDDVLDRAALAAAVEECEGVFHVASPVPTDKIVDPEVSIGRFTWYPN